MRGMTGGQGVSLFEELGLYYIGPVDGHNVEDLVYILNKVKAMPASGPVLIHITTEKGKGYPPAEVAADKMHGKKIECFTLLNLNICVVLLIVIWGFYGNLDVFLR